VSIVSNTLLTFLFKQSLGLPLPLSNLLAIALTALLNFALANVFVFREAE
jgi:putative flippase GtrA